MWRSQTLELIDFQKRFWGTLPLTLSVTVLALLRPGNLGLDGETQHWIALLLTLPVVWWAGWPIFMRGAQALLAHNPNTWTLIGLSANVAFVWSVVATLVPSIIPYGMQWLAGTGALYFVAVAVIISLALLGQILELKARSKASVSIKALLSIAPASAHRIKVDRTREDVLVNQLSAGDVVWVGVGERVPADGLVVHGTSVLNESMLMGESTSVPKQVGDPLFAGTLNTGGSLIMRCERVSSSTVHAQMVQVVSIAQCSRAPTQEIADAVAGQSMLAIVGVAGITFLAWGILEPVSGWPLGLMNAVAVLVFACPCTLSMVTPIAVMFAIGRGALQGILFRDAAAIEGMSKVDTLIIDIGLLRGSDCLNDAAVVAALRELRSGKMHIVLATSVGPTEAHALGKRFGIDGVHAELSPTGKLRLVEQLQREGRSVAIVGDALEDAPALARADVGIAIGNSNHIATSGAPLTLLKGDLRSVVAARFLSLATIANMNQNLRFAVVYHVLGIVLATGLLYPFASQLVPPVIAPFVLTLNMATIVCSALRLRGNAFADKTRYVPCFNN